MPVRMKIIAYIAAILLILLALAGSAGWVNGVLSGYVEKKARAELQASIDSLQKKVEDAGTKADRARRVSDSLRSSAAEKEKDMLALLARIGPLQGKVAELERQRKEQGNKEGLTNAEIKNVGSFVDSLLSYRDSVYRSLPR